MHRGRGRWSMNTTLLKDEPFRIKVRGAWNEWKQHTHRFPDIAHRWVQYAKQRVKLLFPRGPRGMQIGAGWRISVTLQFTMPRENRGRTQTRCIYKLKKLKAKIVRLSSPYRQRLMVDTAEQDQTAGEHPSLHHLLQSRKRQENRFSDR